MNKVSEKGCEVGELSRGVRLAIFAVAVIAALAAVVAYTVYGPELLP